jgi:hypothetical protein
MKKSLAKNLKLTLHRETLRTLEEPVLGAIDGAGTNQRTICGSCATCYWINTNCFP